MDVLYQYQLETWFAVSKSCVKWDTYFSRHFSLSCGVRQGGVLSPYLFAVFVDDVIYKVRSENLGCYISSVCVSIFLYADDILLLAPTIEGLQHLLNVCEREFEELDMCINVKKSVGIRFGPRFNAECVELSSVCGGVLKWVSCCRYLGVYFVSGRTLKCSFSIAKSRFYRAFNAVYSRIGRAASEESVLALLRAKCVPILLYAAEACP